MVDPIEQEVRKEFKQKWRARYVLGLHLAVYSFSGLIFLFTILQGYWSGYYEGVAQSMLALPLWTIVFFAHYAHYYYRHGKGRENREARIQEEVKRRYQLKGMQSALEDPYDYRDEYQNNLSDDGELTQYREDDDHYYKPKREF